MKNYNCRSDRLRWIDIAKAIAIILMALGHSSMPLLLSNFIWAFHMPLFFVASGWTTNWNTYSFNAFVIRRSRTLLLPFIIYSLIVLFIQVQHGWMTMGEWVVKGWGDGYALWFIPVLFLATVIAKSLYSFRNTWGGSLFWVVVVLMFCLGIDFRCYGIRLPWNLSSVPYAVFMIVMGSEWSKFDFNSLRKYRLLVLISTFFIVLVISHFWRLDMCFNNIFPVLPLIVGAFSGTIMVFLVSSLIERNFKKISSTLISLGKETYIVVAFSQITIMLLNEYFQINSIIKYSLLVIILILIKYSKDGMNCMLKN